MTDSPYKYPDSTFYYRDQNWLVEQYWGFNLSTREMGKLSGCTEMTIVFWMNKYGIPLRPSGCRHLEESERRKRQLWSIYKNVCRKYKRELRIDYTTFESIITQPCYYCGETSINGIDRLDSSKGYILDNCVPCCHACNFMKNKHDAITFLYQVHKIQNHTSKKYGIKYFPVVSEATF